MESLLVVFAAALTREDDLQSREWERLDDDKKTMTSLENREQESLEEKTVQEELPF
jgi:hypothetical protein